MSEERYSVQVLRDCIDLQTKKGQDYQNAVSTVKQADYYRLGLNTIYDIMHAKMLRMKSLLETAEHDKSAKVNFESISDSAKDLINYASFFASYAEGKMDGQNPEHDIFNRPKKPEYTFPDHLVVPPVLKPFMGNFDNSSAKASNFHVLGDLVVSGKITAGDNIFVDKTAAEAGIYKEWASILASDEIEDAKYEVKSDTPVMVEPTVAETVKFLDSGDANGAMFSKHTGNPFVYNYKTVENAIPYIAEESEIVKATVEALDSNPDLGKPFDPNRILNNAIWPETSEEEENSLKNWSVERNGHW